MTDSTTADATYVARPAGTITVDNIGTFRAEMLDRIDNGCTDLTVDLADVEMIDSKGLAVFMTCHQAIAEKGGTLTVVSANEDYRDLFHITRMDKYFTVRAH